MLKSCLLLIFISQVTFCSDNWSTNTCRIVGRQRCLPINGVYQTCNGFFWSKFQKCPKGTQCSEHPVSKSNILCKHAGRSCEASDQDKQTCGGKDGFYVCDNGVEFFQKCAPLTECLQINGTHITCNHTIIDYDYGEDDFKNLTTKTSDDATTPVTPLNVISTTSDTTSEIQSKYDLYQNTDTTAATTTAEDIFSFNGYN